MPKKPAKKQPTKTTRSVVRAKPVAKQARRRRLTKEHRETLAALEALPPPKTELARLIRERARATLLTGEPLIDGKNVRRWLGRD